MIVNQMIGTTKGSLQIGFFLLLLAGLGCGESGIATRPVESEVVAYAMPWPHVLTREGVSVYYSEGLDQQAAWFAKATARQLAEVRTRTGFEFGPGKANVYLKLLEPGAPNTRPVIWAWESLLLVEPGKTSCLDIIAMKNNWPFPGGFMHESVEASLTFGPTPRLLLDDKRKTFWGGTQNDFHYTRWFREGFASYAGFLACKVTVVDEGPDADQMRAEVFKYTEMMPFTALATVGTRIFMWNQYQGYTGQDMRDGDDDFEPGEVHTENSYYGASLALFLVIEDRYGQDAIREIIQKVNKLENGSGEDLKRIVREVLGTDIVELVNTFRFPKTGMKLVALWDSTPIPGSDVKRGLWVDEVGADGPAQRAGILKDDVIISLDGDRMVNSFDFEFALYKRMQQQSVKIGLWRKGVGHMTVEMEVRE